MYDETSVSHKRHYNESKVWLTSMDLMEVIVKEEK